MLCPLSPVVEPVGLAYTPSPTPLRTPAHRAAQGRWTRKTKSSVDLLGTPCAPGIHTPVCFASFFRAPSKTDTIPSLYRQGN